MSVRYDGNGNAPNVYTLFLILWALGVFLILYALGFLFTVDQAN